jgi:hypothetical protein
MFMKTFEEKWTAWIDGQLTGKELEEFEATLEDRAAAEAERDQARKLGALLKAHAAAAPAMTNQEFFHHQLRQQIASDGARELHPAEAKPRETWWTIGRLLWTGAASLAVLMLCTFFVLRPQNPGGESAYLTQIKSARVDPVVSPDASVSIFEQKEDRVTVIWINGLESLPSEYAAR